MKFLNHFQIQKLQQQLADNCEFQAQELEMLAKRKETYGESATGLKWHFENSKCFVVKPRAHAGLFFCLKKLKGEKL